MPGRAIRIYRSIERVVIMYRRAVVSVLMLLEVVLANYLAFLLRFEGVIPSDQIALMIEYLPYLLVLRLIFYFQAGLHKNLWRYSSVGDLSKILISTTFGSMAFVLLVRTIFGDVSYPRSVYILDWILFIMISGGVRLFIRVFRDYLQSEYSGKKALIVGAGDAGEMIVRDMRNNPHYNYAPIGFIDDDPYKKGLSIHGIPIFGPRSVLGEVIERYDPDEILFCIPSASPGVIRDIYESCKPFNIPIKTLPGLSDILHGKVTVSNIRSLSMKDLLQRKQVHTDTQPVKEYIQGKRVLITGAGGSIGAELARQIHAYAPSKLVLVDRYENGLYHTGLELRGNASETETLTVIGDVLDAKRLDYIFSRHKPHIVFHAAAHKHVPLMEENPFEAVKNNVFGTKNMIDMALRFGVESFVMISTDKAVNPSNVMGATKRIAEFLVFNANAFGGTKFNTVRFGNVLGSNGSVLEIFRDQLERRVPLTVTHPDIKRFFMLIPEAVQLVLVAASSGGGKIYVLDMGEQIRILDLAENFIRLSGFVPHEDVQIDLIGLRPGEKMYEELFDESEEIVQTPIESLRMAVPRCPSPDELVSHVLALEAVVRDYDIEGLVPAIQKIVPGFKR